MWIRIAAIFSLIFFANTAFSQDDPVLFTVGDSEVRVSEFDYIYSKTNGDKADFSEASLKEYLDLYTNFKLKVQRARDLKLDTIPALQQELAGYRKQLANNYLMDRQVMEKLIKEVYDRLSEDVSVSHILVSLPEGASPKDTLAAYRKAMGYKAKLDKGENFEDMAIELSDDNSAKTNKGFIGYITAMQLPGFYNIENAAYTTPLGRVSLPVRTHLGYHLIRVNDRRPARGEINASHILVRVDGKESEADAQAKINKAYKSLQDGKSFIEAAKEYSEDETTSGRGGSLGVFGINRYETAFEEAVFSLSRDGEFSRPFRSSVGWHIVQRVKKLEVGKYEDIKRKLKSKIKNDSRYQIVQDELVNAIKADAGFMENDDIRDAYIKSLDKSFLSYQWKAPTELNGQELFILAGEKVTVADFGKYLARNGNIIVREGRGSTPAAVGQKMYTKFLNAKCLAYEEKQLETKYPEFKALMREYEEGILLFEAQQRLVWNKASQDSVGLAAFYAKNKSNYKWGKRVVATVYTLDNSQAEQVESIRAAAKKKSGEELTKQINQGEENLLNALTNTFEKGQNPLVDKVKWKKGTVGMAEMQKDFIKFVKIESVMKPTLKTLEESRGYVVADYQDNLEQNWIKELKAAYDVKLNNAVFKTLVK